MTLSPLPASGAQIASWLLAALALIAILPLHLLPAMLAGLLVYHLVGAMARRLSHAVSSNWAKLLAVGVLSAIVIGILVAAGFGITVVLKTETGSISELFAKLAELMVDVRTALPPWVTEPLPSDGPGLEEMVMDWLHNHSQVVGGFGTSFGRSLVKILIGMIIGAMVSLHEVRPAHLSGPLALALQERVRRIALAFRQVVFAQIRISALNTALSAIFLAVALPLFGVHLPLTKTLIAITFITGLLPVVGNLISNSLITFVALSVSLPIAVAALGYLIVIHKLEYFLNAKIVGGQINARSWEILIAMLTMEAIFGIIGLVAAPIYYALLKNELTARGLL